MYEHNQLKACPAGNARTHPRPRAHAGLEAVGAGGDRCPPTLDDGAVARAVPARGRDRIPGNRLNGNACQPVTSQGAGAKLAPDRHSRRAADEHTTADDDCPAATIDSEKLTVFYDGACPLCEREIGFYRRRKGADRVSWVDVSRSCSNQVAPGLSKERALARFHVLDAEGRLVSGGEAFAKLWRALPGFRILGRVFWARPLVLLLNGAYDLFLPLRPRIQALLRARPAADAEALPAWLRRELRSDHAGETGAVGIYRGILAVSRSSDIRRFAAAHLETERRHLALIEAVLPHGARSVFLPLWRLAGFVTGAVPAVFGRNAVFATIDAVETFVDRHYADQIDRLSREGTHVEIRALLVRCREDEIHHRDEARASIDRPAGVVARVWRRMVGAGSAAAVAVARRV